MCLDLQLYKQLATMEKLICNPLNHQSLPESYILPPEKRPNILPKYKSIPVIDLAEVDRDRKAIVEQIITASEDFGFFQVINAGISESIIKGMMDVAEEFFMMPIEDRMLMYSEDPKQVSRLYTSIDYNNEKTHFWRDTLRHPGHPVETYKHLWPSKPTNYKDAAGIYSTAARSLGLKLLELIAEGLGVRSDYFQDELSAFQYLVTNHYPPCPDPTLTLGLPQHCDPNLITVLLQGEVSGLQVLNQGEWIAVEPRPNAFVINLGHQLEIISNGRLKSVEHRVVTNSSSPRTTVTTFIYPSMDCIVKAEEGIINEFNPRKYRDFKCEEFLQVFLSLTGDAEAVLKAFTL